MLSIISARWTRATTDRAEPLRRAVRSLQLPCSRVRTLPLGVIDYHPTLCSVHDVNVGTPTIHCSHCFKISTSTIRSGDFSLGDTTSLAWPGSCKSSNVGKSQSYALRATQGGHDY